LISKYLALSNAGQEALPPIAILQDGSGSGGDAAAIALQTLQHIRAEELSHFRMLCECMRQLGGDPTAQTPCADTTATASMGLLQVLTDPRTTLAQCLNAILTAELTDNAGWELLAELAEQQGRTELTDPFEQAHQAEQRHLQIVRGWLSSLLSDQAGTTAV